MKNCFCTKANCKLAWVGEKLSHVLLLAIRLICGWGFIHAGFGKLSNASNVMPFFESLGLPGYMVYIVGAIELIGGILLALGLFSRIAALALIVIMVGAYFTAHSAALYNIFGDFAAFTKEAPFLFLLASLTVFSFGPGCLSLDAWKMKKCCSDGTEGDSCCSSDSSHSSCCG